MAVLSKIHRFVSMVRRYVTKEECNMCREANRAKRQTLEEMINGMRREQRLGFAIVTIFIAVAEILLRIGVI
jgi:hypothetical protein